MTIATSKYLADFSTGVNVAIETLTLARFYCVFTLAGHYLGSIFFSLPVVYVSLYVL